VISDAAEQLAPRDEAVLEVLDVLADDVQLEIGPLAI